MSATLSRGPLTDALLAELAGVGKPVGDAQQPPGAAWGSAPNGPASSYTPYIVLTPMASSRSTGAIGNPQGEWQLPYSISAYGVLRTQCEWMADHARIALVGMRNTTLDLDGEDWTVQQVWTSLIDRPTPNYATDPPIWAQHDQVSIWLTKELT